MSVYKSYINAPLVNLLKKLSYQSSAPFHTPGHKKGQGISPSLASWLGTKVFQADLPELPELDNLFAPEGVIKSAQDLAASTFGAEHTWFLVNGSTCGVMAAIVATCHAGDKIILPRNIHQSAIAGLIVSGAIPIFINPEYNPNLDLAYSVTPETVALALQNHPDAKAVMVVHPTYHGICGNLVEIAKITHQYNLPLLVDEAHGAHFAFHPDLPISALEAGADVAIQSTHKVLGAMTQASMLHLQGNRVNPQCISKALQLFQSTSPNYLLLASLDAAREQMASQGEELMAKTLKLATEGRKRIKLIPGLTVLESSYMSQPGFFAWDATRITVFMEQLDIDGFTADEILHQELGVTAELPLLNHLMFMVTFGNSSEDIDKLVAALTTLAQKHYQADVSPSHGNPMPFSCSDCVMSPRDAFFAPSEALPLKEAINRISAELVCPYPPGIPVLMPGELITVEAVEYLQAVIAVGGMITGGGDSSLATLQVVS